MGKGEGGRSSTDWSAEESVRYEAEAVAVMREEVAVVSEAGADPPGGPTASVLSRAAITSAPPKALPLPR